MSRLFPQALIDTITAGGRANEEALATLVAHALNDWTQSGALDGGFCAWWRPRQLAKVALEGADAFRSTVPSCDAPPAINAHCGQPIVPVLLQAGHSLSGEQV